MAAVPNTWGFVRPPDPTLVRDRSVSARASITATSTEQGRGVRARLQDSIPHESRQLEPSLEPGRALIITLCGSLLLHAGIAALMPGLPERPVTQPAGSLSIRIGGLALPTSPETPVVVDALRQQPPIDAPPSQAALPMLPTAEPLVAANQQSMSPAHTVDPVVPAPMKTPLPVTRQPSDDRSIAAHSVAAPKSSAARAQPPSSTAMPAASAEPSVSSDSSDSSDSSGDAHASQVVDAPASRSTEAAIPVTVRITDPVYRSPPRPPVYPSRAVRFGQQGTVIVRAHLSLQGDVRDAEVHDSSGSRLLDDAALAAARSWRFEPARRDGRSVLAVVDLPVHFRLKN